MNKESKHCFTLSELRELFNKAGQSTYAFNLPIFSHEIHVLRKQLYIEQRTKDKEVYLKFIYQSTLKDDLKTYEIELPLKMIFDLSSESLFELFKDSIRNK